MARRATQRLARERAIQGAARRLFLAHGLENTTMDQIAEAADVSRATLFNYYPGKPALLVALGGSLEQRLVKALHHYRDKHEQAPEALSELFAHAARVLEQTAALTRLLLRHNSGDQGLPALLDAFVLLAADGQAQGQWRDDLPAQRLGETLYLSFVASLLGWCPGEPGATKPLESRCADLNRLLAVPRVVETG